MMRRFYLGFLLIASTVDAAVAQPIIGSPPALVVAVDAAVVREGSKLAIRWTGAKRPAGSKIALFIKKIATGHLIGPIVEGSAMDGQLQWIVPVFQPRAVSCARDPTGGCVSDMNPNASYCVLAVLTKNEPLGSRERLAVAESNVFLFRGRE